jgi:ornithine decarboxylase
MEQLQDLPDPEVSTTEFVNNKIASEDPDLPFFVVSLSKVLAQAKEWEQRLPRVTPFYAMKCNPNPVILALLASLGWSFDCASMNEIAAVLALKVDTSRIIYANPCKQLSHLKYARAVGVTAMTFDNEAELRKIAKTIPDARVVLRIATDDSQALCQLSKKFGAKMHEIESLLDVAAELGLNLAGVSFHVGSGCKSAHSFADAIANARSVFDMAIARGFNPTILDIGGGFPGFEETGAVGFAAIADVVNAALDENFPSESGVTIIAEPGRYIAASSAVLVTKVHAVRTVKSAGSDEELRCLYMNDGVYGSFNCIIFDHVQPLPALYRATSADELAQPTKIFGPTCDSMDCVVERTELPSCDVGDYLVWHNMGAYTSAAASTFNAFPTAEINYVW